MSGFVRLAALSALRRQQQDLRATLPPVADFAAGLPVALHVLLAVQVLRLTHLDPPSPSSLIVNLACVLTNRSAPPATVTPVLIYPDVRAAVEWLESAFGFEERVRIGDAHRAQLRVGTDGAIVVADVRSDQVAPSAGVVTQLLKVRVPDVDAAFARARDFGARALQDPTTHEYGERSCVL